MTQTPQPRVVSLFSGIGATDLALEHLGCETVAHSDVEAFTLDVFAKRFPRSVPLGSVVDITEVPECEVMAGGFPCQDISNAGKRVGIGGERSGLWSEFFRLIGLARPRVVLIENVSALLARGVDVVLADLASIGYAVEWDCIPAAAVGAPHLRDRIWMVAYAEDEPVVREDRLERPLATLSLPPAKWPRAGRMCQGAVFVREPIAPRKTKRLNPGSAWVGVQLDRRHGWWHAPLWQTPTAAPWNHGGGGGELQAQVNHRPVFPTPSAVSYGSNRLTDSTTFETGAVRHSLESMARHAMWPTPTKADGEGGPRATLRPGRTSPTDLRSAVYGDGPGPLNPQWVEWVMGFPIGHTDLSRDVVAWHGWNYEPSDAPRTAEGVENRGVRLAALGNAQVPQVMRYWAAPVIDRLR